MGKKQYPLLNADRKTLFKFVILLLLLAVMIILTIRFFPKMLALRDPAVREFDWDRSALAHTAVWRLDVLSLSAKRNRSASEED